MKNEQAISTLRGTLSQVRSDSKDDLFRIGAQIAEAKGSVIAKYAPMFSPENLDQMTAEGFRGFLLFRNNQHWDAMHRQGGWMTEDMPKLRKAIRLLVDESLPLQTRLDRLRPSSGEPIVKGLGRAVITATLQIVYPEKYGILNNTAEAGMKLLGLWPEYRRGASFGERYEAVNRVLLQTAADVETDLWTLDMLWWRIANSHVPKGADLDGYEEPTTSAKEDRDQVAPSDEASETSFALERYLHEFLADNWAMTDLGKDWALFEEDGEIVGSYYNTGEVGEIDLLARHRHDKAWLVVELKKGQSSDSTVGQILRYMTWVRKNLAKDGSIVKGIIICRSIDQTLQYALDGQANIECLTYEVSFALKAIPRLS